MTAVERRPGPRVDCKSPVLAAPRHLNDPGRNVRHSPDLAFSTAGPRCSRRAGPICHPHLTPRGAANHRPSLSLLAHVPRPRRRAQRRLLPLASAPFRLVETQTPRERLDACLEIGTCALCLPCPPLRHVFILLGALVRRRAGIEEASIRHVCAQISHVRACPWKFGCIHSRPGNVQHHVLQIRPSATLRRIACFATCPAVCRRRRRGPPVSVCLLQPSRPIAAHTCSLVQAIARRKVVRCHGRQRTSTLCDQSLPRHAPLRLQASAVLNLAARPYRMYNYMHTKPSPEGNPERVRRTCYIHT